MTKSEMIDSIQKETSPKVFNLGIIDAEAGADAERRVNSYVNEVETDAIPSTFKDVANLFTAPSSVSAEELDETAAHEYIMAICREVDELYSATVLKKTTQADMIAMLTSLNALDEIDTSRYTEVNIGGIVYNQYTLLSAWNAANSDQAPIHATRAVMEN